MKDAYFFSHDSNARHDPRILELRAAYGAQGYGWYWMIVEILRDQATYKIKVKDSIWGALALDLNADKNELKQFITDCIDQFELLSSDGNYIWSNSLIRRMAKREEIARLRAEAGRIGGKVKKQKEQAMYTEEEWQEMVNFFEGRCVKCGLKVQSSLMIKDYILPASQGGSGSIVNIQPLCQACSQSRGDDNTDYRIIYCKANGKQMPSKWQAKPSYKRKGKEIKEEEIKLKNISRSGIEKIITYFNQKFNKNYKLTDDIVDKVKTRLKTFSVDQLIKAIEIVSSIPFYTGLNDRGWRATPKWLFGSDSKVDELLNKEDEIDMSKILTSKARDCFVKKDMDCDLEISIDIPEKCKVCFKERAKWMI
jgi:hypothetical protein